MSKADQFKNQIKRKRPSALANYIGEDVSENNHEKENDVNNVIENNTVEINKSDINDKIYVNIDNNNNNVVDVINDDEEYLKELLQGKKPLKKKPKKVFTSFYMDPDLAEEIAKISKNGTKGDKSKLINTAIRKLLKEYGLV